MNQPLSIDQISLGQTYETTVQVDEKRIAAFAQATDDDNPIHFDDEAAAKSIFGRRVAQGMLTAGFLSGVFGTQFPGSGTIYLSQTVRFLRPVFIGDAITMRLKVLELWPEKTASGWKPPASTRTARRWSPARPWSCRRPGSPEMADPKCCTLPARASAYSCIPGRAPSRRWWRCTASPPTAAAGKPSPASWRAAAALVALDLRGRGGSDKPEHGYDLEHHCADLDGVLDDLGQERAVLMGHSLGAYISLAYAATRPQRVERLILVDGGAVLSPEQWGKVAQGIGPSLERLAQVYASVEDMLAQVRQALPAALEPGHGELLPL